MLAAGGGAGWGAGSTTALGPDGALMGATTGVNTGAFRASGTLCQSDAACMLLQHHPYAYRKALLFLRQQIGRDVLCRQLVVNTGKQTHIPATKPVAVCLLDGVQPQPTPAGRLVLQRRGHSPPHILTVCCAGHVRCRGQGGRVPRLHGRGDQHRWIPGLAVWLGKASLSNKAGL